jgi:transcriptional regulator with XRE-family HTH domain
MGRPRVLAPCRDAAMGALVRWVHARLGEAGVTYGQVAAEVAYSRSWVSRSLSGRRLPPWDLVEAVASRCGASLAEARRLWAAAEAADRSRRSRMVAPGAPPDGITSYDGLLDALAGLIAGRAGSHRELVRRDGSGQLTRQTVGAVLRRERTLSCEVLTRILAACEVGDDDRAAWLREWDRWGRPLRDAMEVRRRAIARARLRSWRYPAPRWS